MKQVNLRICQTILTLILGLFLSVGTYAQDITVKGQVKDASGMEVIGANIVEKENPTKGTITDYDGNFTLTVPKGTTLTISYIGYKTQDIVVDQPTLVVILQDDTELLSEVVVIGYGVARKNDLTGSVTAIKPDEMNKGLVTTPQDMLQGKIAGVSVINGGGEPGGGATIRIRGGSSLNASNDPLIVIDGLAMDNYGVQGLSNPLALVNPADIETFTVLKDASATAIYGSRASNGVILITTKKGQRNSKPRISYNGNVSVSMVTNKVDMLDSKEYVDFVQNLYGYTDEEFLTSPEYASLGYVDAQGNHVFANTDWQDEIYRTAVSTDHNLTIAGGLKNMPYRISVGYTNQDGILKTSSFERYTASVNLSPSFIDDHLKINFNAKGMYSKTTYANTGAIGGAASMDPTKPVYGGTEFYDKNFGGYWQWAEPVTREDDPEWGYQINTLAPVNPVSLLNTTSDKGRSKVLMGNFEADYKVHGLEDLHLHVNAGMDIATGKSNKHYSRYNEPNYYFGSTGWNTQDTYNLSLNMYAQYMKDFGENHHFDIMGGYEWQHFRKETDYYYYGTYPQSSLSHAGEIYNPSENTLYKTENYLVSFFGRMNYSLLNRYLFTFTLRDDGSSRFSKKNRWGLFPSAALAWKVKEESFLREVDAISELKFRIGFGATGQQEGIGDYTYFASYTPNSEGAYYPILGDGVTYRPDAYNSNLTWEKTTTYNIGLDWGFFDNRFTANIDYYYRKTTDLINNVYVAAGSNFKNKVTSNIGSLHNQGIEFAMNWRAIQQQDWLWEIGFNLTHNTNEIDELVKSTSDKYIINHGGIAVGDAGTNGIKGWSVGEAVSAFHTYQQVYDENGQPLEGEFVDRDGNGIINNNDRYFYKKADADVLLGLTSKMIYKNWDFGFSLRASLGNYAYNAVDCNRSNLSISGIYSGSAWHNIPQMAVDKNWKNVSSMDALSDYFIQNASFLKCDNITLGYSFDKLFGQNISGRTYLTAQNVFTISKYKGIDPEISGGYDGSIYPRPFVGIFGLSLNF
ncbi:TonB-linked SusC/RagA family outer membrane protein [Parabacteroides sp. PFB2-10]|uniref:SusC/RagA family TonB-linked outer membrane protein n=1 Tax=Parabacteroides sp. PFB2-10 TaxID=1742405 RepID=UPI002475DD24|nr:TonB-dependent receptor [Parabacteroides sp. PFB2-10]MDH6313827.1 TonB-linked SusC/RagA family outer membrane protein [Parabacteroides sp. PFB2-10]